MAWFSGELWDSRGRKILEPSPGATDVQEASKLATAPSPEQLDSGSCCKGILQFDWICEGLLQAFAVANLSLSHADSERQL